MARDWIDKGLRHARERAAQHRLESERHHHQTAVIKEKGPVLLRSLVAEVSAAVDEYKRSANTGNHELEFEVMPHEGFCIAKTMLPRVSLECRPDYEGHVLCCNMTRVDDQESKPVEWLFNLNLAVDESNNVTLSRETRAFQSMDEAAESILTPVLFPPLDQPPPIR